jgi:hypothetical protein
MHNKDSFLGKIKQVLPMLCKAYLVTFIVFDSFSCQKLSKTK